MTGGFRVVAEQRFRCQIREGGFSFCFIHHGEEALATLAVEADIDLMLLDFNIPVMDGLTLLARLREEQAPVKAIIVSAYGETPKLPDAAGGALPIIAAASQQPAAK